MIGSVQMDADIHKIDSDNVSNKHKNDAQTKPVKKDSDKPKGDKKDNKMDEKSKPVEKDTEITKGDQKDNKMDTQSKSDQESEK